jgi:hypothetical protein
MDHQEPASADDIAEVKRRLDTYSNAQSFDTATVRRLIRLIECQQEELNEQSKTIRHLAADEDEMAEAEASTDNTEMIFGEP